MLRSIRGTFPYHPTPTHTPPDFSLRNSDVFCSLVYLGMRKGTPTFLLTYLHAFVWRREIMLLLANAGTSIYEEFFPLILVVIVFFYYFFLNENLFHIYCSNSGHCRRQWGSMCWRSFLLDPQLGRRLLPGFKLCRLPLLIQNSLKELLRVVGHILMQEGFEDLAVWILIWIWTVLFCSICFAFLSYF